MKEILKNVNMREFNAWMVEIHQMTTELNNAVKLLKTKGCGGINLDDLFDNPEVIYDKYLNPDIISKETLKQYNLEGCECDNPYYMDCEIKIEQLVREARFTRMTIDKIKQFLDSCGLYASDLFKIKGDKVLETSSVEHYYFSTHGNYTDSDEEIRVLLNLQKICGVLEELCKYKVTPDLLEEIIVKNNNDEYGINIRAFDKFMTALMD